ncbi:MAG TPA: hypothetical protein DCG69_00260 [Bacteroidales bacterium]|nr:hypothetical protein [Bacteroidales bacterium]
MSVLVNFAIFPTDIGTSVSSEVSLVIKMLMENNVAFELNAMGTVFETQTVSQALKVIQKAYTVLKAHKRVYLVLTMDIQKNKSKRIRSKIESIKNKLI